MDVSKQIINYHDSKVSCHRLDREIFRICPTKLSKKELEELYYELTDANICLKKTINSQKDKIKMLTTKVLRMTAVQRVYTNKDSSCCSNYKVIIEEQKDCISELKRANDRLAEKVRQLNTKLCSAKQFLTKRSPYHSTPRSKKAQSLKQSASSLNTKQSEINIRDPLHNHDSDMPSPILAESTNRTTRNEISVVKEEISSRKSFENSKYATEIENLKQIISKLQLQLAEMSQDHSSKLSHIGEELSRLKEENLQLRAERNDAKNIMKSKSDEYRKCSMRLMDLETQCNDLTVELSLSKRRVSEMETRTKSVELSDQLSKTIEQHLANESHKRNQLMITKEFDYRDGYHAKEEQSSVQNVDTSTSPRKKTSKENAANFTKDERLEQKLEDSGFNEPVGSVGNATTTDDGKELLRLNQELIKKLTQLQNQLDSLQTSTIKPQPTKPNKENNLKETLPSNSKQSIDYLNVEYDDIPEDIAETNTGLRYSTPIKTDSKPIRTIENEKTGIYSDDFDASNKESVKSLDRSLNRKTEAPDHKRSPSKIASKVDSNKGEIPKAVNPKLAQKAKIEKPKTIQRNLLNTETYSVKRSLRNRDVKIGVKIKKDLSSDDTENDVSSFTSVEDDDKEARYRLSLGERRHSSGYTETESPCTSAELDCLSEGEVVLGQRLSVGESPLFRHRTMQQTTKEDLQPLTKSIEGTLQAITKELNLCGKLLNFQPSAEVPRNKRSI